MLALTLGIAFAASPTWTFVDTVPDGFEVPGLRFTDVDSDLPGVQVTMEVWVLDRTLSVRVTDVLQGDGIPVQLPVLNVPNFGGVSYVAPACGKVWIWGRPGRVAFDWARLGDGVAEWTFPEDPRSLAACPDADVTEIRGSLGPLPSR